MKFFMKLAYQYIAIFLNFSTTSSHLHPLQVENCGSNSRLVVDEDDNGKFRPARSALNNYHHSLNLVITNCLNNIIFIIVHISLGNVPFSAGDLFVCIQLKY